MVQSNAAKQRLRSMVTDHVLIRWLERVEGYDFKEIRNELRAKEKKPNDRNVLNYLAQKFGLFPGHVIYKILTKEVQCAIKLGASKFHAEQYTLIIVNGCIVTLIPR